MKLNAVAATAIAIASSVLTAPALRPALAQPSGAANETRSVPFGDTQIVLQAPSQHCLLDTSQAADQELAALFFRPRAGNLNTYLGAFLDCKTLTALRSTGPEKVQVFGYAYYLAFTATGTNPVPPSRDQILRRTCDGTRTKNGTLDLADETALRELEAKMAVLPIGKPWFGPVVAQDDNGCYQIILYKRAVLGVESREALVTIVTFVKRRQVTYTRAMPYSNAWLMSFVKMVQSEVATFVELNP
jgi:hypothetical protein